MIAGNILLFVEQNKNIISQVIIPIVQGVKKVLVIRVMVKESDEKSRPFSILMTFYKVELVIPNL